MLTQIFPIFENSEILLNIFEQLIKLIEDDPKIVNLIETINIMKDDNGIIDKIDILYKENNIIDDDDGFMEQ